MRRAWVRLAVACALPLLLGACAAVPRETALPISDPHEPVNRQVMEASQLMLRPASVIVKAVIPGAVRDRLHDLNANLKEPRIFVNTLLQGRFKAAAYTGTRFMVNTMFGLGGLVDLAGRQGMQQESGDFGQTLFVWGVPEGPYVVRPYLGPATLRDGVGSTVDMFANPTGFLIGTQLAVIIATTGLDAADRLGQLKQAEDASIDFYSFVRSSYYQMRRAELREAIGLPSVVDSPALDDPDAPPAADASRPAPAPATSRPAPAPAAGRSASGAR
jgi:phospholipid-binding lipoprotein MlaA